MTGVWARVYADLERVADMKFRSGGAASGNGHPYRDAAAQRTNVATARKTGIGHTRTIAIGRVRTSRSGID